LDRRLSLKGIVLFFIKNRFNKSPNHQLDSNQKN
jgi:hypothetical protein